MEFNVFSTICMVRPLKTDRTSATPLLSVASTLSDSAVSTVAVPATSTPLILTLLKSGPATSGPTKIFLVARLMPLELRAVSTIVYSPSVL
ncbi:hypothetical protein ASE76_16045 [Xylophilus sp. Leaf220]|nr:hypothetical protein ASE76_16045 [Xylophilus sp. Leaf220]